jgi:peptidoglycan/LPS O-acetylase OafA/YrhL
VLAGSVLLVCGALLTFVVVEKPGMALGRVAGDAVMRLVARRRAAPVVRG